MRFFKPNLTKMNREDDFEGLIRALNDESNKIREKAEEILEIHRPYGYFDRRKFINLLIIEREKKNSPIKEKIVHILDIQGNHLALDLLSYGDSREKKFYIAESFLSDIRNYVEKGIKTPIEKLVLALASNEKDYRKKAAMALKKLGWQPDSIENKVRYLIELEQWSALVHLNEQALAPLCNYVQNQSSINGKAVRILGQIGGLRVVEPLIQVLKSRCSPVIGNVYGGGESEVIEVLGDLRDPRAVNVFIDFIKYVDEAVENPDPGEWVTKGDYISGYGQDGYWERAYYDPTYHLELRSRLLEFLSKMGDVGKEALAKYRESKKSTLEE
jgi:HEAT repeat protein